MRSVPTARPSIPNSYCLAITAVGALTTPPKQLTSSTRTSHTPRRIVPSGLDDNGPEDHPDIIAAELRSFFQAEQFA